MDVIDFSQIKFPQTVNVTDQEIDISTLSETQKQFYVDLFTELVSTYHAKQRARMVVGMAGPAGAGKSMTAVIFKEIARQVSLPFRFEAVGIDAFHYPNSFLLAHERNGESLKSHKGRFDTYDVTKLVAALKHFKKGEQVSFPEYSRKTHDPIENAVVIKSEEPTLLLVEGLWVLYDKNGWENVCELLDFTIFMEAHPERVKDGVVARHVRGGRTHEDALEYYEANEAKNFDLIMATKDRADKIIPAY